MMPDLEAMVLEVRALRERHRDAVRAAGWDWRNASIVALRDRGFGLCEIADTLQIPRERVRQIERARRGEHPGPARVRR